MRPLKDLFTRISASSFEGLNMMQEVLSKTTDANIPLQEQEYFELRLDDLGFPFRPLWVESIGIVVQHRFLIRQAHGAWSEVDRNIMWEGYDLDECSTLEEAQRYYELRRSAIKDKGFIYSDIDYWGVWHGCAKSM